MRQTDCRQTEPAWRLNPMQLAWLQELGVEAVLLRPYAAPPATGASGATAVPEIAQGLRARATGAHSPVQRSPATESQYAIAPQHSPSRRISGLVCQLYGLQETAVTPAASQRPAPRWLIVRETPAMADVAGAWDRATRLLHAILAAVGMQPGDTVIHLQTPHALQTAAAQQGVSSVQDQLKAQLPALQATCILALGRAAATAVLDHGQDNLQALRGKVWSCMDAQGKSIPVVVTYPPGWLLANPRHKVHVWRDLLLARAACGTHAVSPVG